MLRLAQHRLLPGDAEPAQIVEDRRYVLLAAAGDVDVLDAHEEAAAEPLCHVKAGEGRQRVPEVQRAVGARGRNGGQA